MVNRQQFGMKRGLKRHKAPQELDSKKKKLAKRDITALNSAGDASTEAIIADNELHHTLSGVLQPCDESPADAYKKRRRQDSGKSDEEEEEAEVSESGSLSEDEDSGEEAAGSRDNQGALETDQERRLGVNAQSMVEASVSPSSFHAHLGHNLSEGEVENLSKKKWKYKWDVPAFDMPDGKWVGTGECFLKDIGINSNYGLKQKLYDHWLHIYETSGGSDFHSSKQRFFFSLCNSYRDILHCNKRPFYLRGGEVDSSTMDAYLMHCLNHIFRTRDLVTKNDSKVAKHRENASDEILVGDGFLDHGFTRPKVLILLPFRNIAHQVVYRLIQLTPQAYKTNVDHMDRFVDEFGPHEDEDNVDDKQNLGKSKSQKSSKPSDFQALFDGNCDDNFMIGIKFTRKSIKLFNDFYSSDLIVASPFSIRCKIDKVSNKKEPDADYLSSIEVLVLDYADVITMQNWDFAKSALEQLNRIPSNQHGTDIMRIRKWYLDGHARFFRQTIILGHYVNPDINASFSQQCVNHEGKVKLVCKHKGILPKVSDHVRQIYERFEAKSVADADDARLDYFIQKIYPKIKDSTQGGIMLFTSTYFEYVRLRKFLKSQNASFCVLGEYATQSDISRSRLWFFQGTRKIMLYTERSHFYHRYKIRGIHKLIMYSLPERKEFYYEVVNMLKEAEDATCSVLFSPFDLLRLERIVGDAPARRMVTSDKSVFVFC